MRLRFILPFVGALFTAGCDAPITEPDENGRRLGVIAEDDDGPRIDVPLLVDRGVDVTLTVITLGGGCVTKGDTEVTQEGNAVRLRVYDYYAPATAICPMFAGYNRHEATVRFQAEGSVRITGANRDGRVVTYTRPVFVH